MFNKYIWQTYLNGGGKEIVKLFEDNLRDELSKSYIDELYKMHRVFCPSEQISQYVCYGLNDVLRDVDERTFYYGCYSVMDLIGKEYSTSEIMQIFYDGLNEDTALKPTQIFEEFSLGLSYYTTFLHMIFPDIFVPYYYLYNFNVFEKIAQEFDIDLPPIPLKKDYQGRVLYYGHICEALNAFRKKNDMTPYELCAFLYDFAPKYIGGIDSYIIKDLPEPKSAYFIGGSADDYLLSETENTITAWQCNPDTMAGDMIVMYLRTPISAIDSIWRSVSPGFNDPFFYYYRCTYISRPCKIRKISQKHLGRDPIFNKIPIVKKNMQGINGVELPPSVYNHMVEISKKELPLLEYFIESGEGLELSREKDVENKLIKPFLSQLGYSENEYCQQLYIEIGNHNHALIPDFVIHPIVSKGHQTADFLIEAKFSITNSKFLDEVKTQARGYAKLLDAKYAVLAAKEGIWITEDSDDYTKTILTYTWQELKNADNFYKVFSILGNGKK